MSKPSSSFFVKAFALAASLTVSAAPSFAEGVKAPAIFKENRCHSCHSVDKFLIGPNYKAISLRHAANKELAREALITKTLHGGGGNWGLAVMVPNEHVSREDAETMIDWILNLDAN